MLKGDSKDYNLLAKWVEQLSPRDFYLSVEIGVREGYGSHVIMENLKNKNHNELTLVELHACHKYLHHQIQT